MRKVYVIKYVDSKMYYYKFGSVKWTKNISGADYIVSKQQTEDIIKTLPKGKYEITKIYIN